MSFVSQRTLLCSHFAVWSYYCMECEKTCNYKNRQNCESDYTCSRSKEKKRAYTSHPTQYYVRNVLEYLATVTNELCACGNSCKKCGHWFAGSVSNNICKSDREEDRNQIVAICFVRL